MIDDVILAKATTIERCVARAREELAGASEFATDFTRQDAATLNVLRACEAAVDMAYRIVRLRKLGAPASNREAFEALYCGGVIDEALTVRLKKMVGFRNIGVHRYTEMNLAILEQVIRSRLDDVLAFSALALRL